MNKLLNKLITGALGLSMAVGVGTIVNKNNIRPAKADVSPDFVLVTSFNKDRDDYYLSPDGEIFGVAGQLAKLNFVAPSKSTLKVSFISSASPNLYAVKLGNNFYLNHPENNEDITLTTNALAPIIWNVLKDTVGFYFSCTHDEQYVGLSSPENPYARAYFKSSSHQTFTPIYLYEKSSSKAAYAFADEFNTRLSGICQNDGSTNLTDLQNAWNGETVGDVRSLKTIYKDFRDTLSDSEQTAFDNIFINTTPNASGNAIEKALSLYRHLVDNRRLEDFVTSIANEEDTSSANPNLIINQNDSKFSNVIIIVISSISLVALGGFLLIKKKKEE